ncbi:MAG TPA: hypothetical protein VGE05_15110 [Novosphingobium sp.]
MTYEARNTGLIRQLWERFLETSHVAVAIHYRAPWSGKCLK